MEHPSLRWGMLFFTGGAGGRFCAKQLLLFTLTTRPLGATNSRCEFAPCPLRLWRAFADGWSSFFALWQRTKQENTPKGLMPFGFPWCWAEAIDISAPRQKCLSTFFLGCENDPRYRFAASGNPKISLLQGFIDVPLPFGKKLFIPTLPFSLCRRRVRPKSSIEPQPNPSWRRCRTRRSVCTCPHL